MNRYWTQPFLLLVMAAIAVGGVCAAVPVAAAPSYEQDITPILRTYCSGCHNDRDMTGQLSVERFASLRRGGEGSGDSVTPGDAAASVMIQRIESTDGGHMPPDDEPQVPTAELATLKAWIAAGATGPQSDASILRSLTVPKLPPHRGIKPVTAAAVSPDGSRLVVARGRTVELFDARAPAGGAGLLSLADLPGKVTAVHFSRDGRQLVLAGGITGLTGVAQVRDAVSGAVISRFEGHRDLLYDAELSPDEQTLATAGYDRSIKLWNMADGSLIRSIDGHNGAVFDLAWHPTGKLLASASADETVKLWRAADGVRLDTLNQPQGEISSVCFSPDGRHVIAAGRDKRIHLWKLTALDAPAINPPLHALFAHESPIVTIGLSADGRHLFTSAEDRSLKCWSVPELVLEHDFPLQPDLISVLVPRDAQSFLIGRMDGSLEAVALEVDALGAGVASGPVTRRDGPAALVGGAAESAGNAAVTLDEREPNDTPSQALPVSLPVVIKGAIGRAGDPDCFRFAARAGELLVLDVNAARSKSKLDSRIEVLDSTGNPVVQVILQATRDSWFTFLGKDSKQSGDYRLQNWMEMELDEYVYASGEVVKLWRYPDGPDSGFVVYPGEGDRHTFFGTSAITHALGEPAWIVTPLQSGSKPKPNGLPVVPIFYENDDEPTRQLGSDSQVLFKAPADGEYVVRVTDVRGSGSAINPGDYHYALAIRPPAPAFTVAVAGKDPKVSPGSGRELVFTATRAEGFSGPIVITVENLPAGFVFHGPIEIPAGQRKAIGVLSAGLECMPPDEAADKAVTVRAKALVDGLEVVQDLGSIGNVQLAEQPKLTVEILPGEDRSSVTQEPGKPLELSIRPGQTITAKVKATRHDFKDRIELGGSDSGRNLPYGVFVDNIGLNGLLIVEGQEEREFFITAAPVAKPQRRLFHLRTKADGEQSSPPVVINVLPATAE